MPQRRFVRFGSLVAAITLATSLLGIGARGAVAAAGAARDTNGGGSEALLIPINGNSISNYSWGSTLTTVNAGELVGWMNNSNATHFIYFYEHINDHEILAGQASSTLWNTSDYTRPGIPYEYVCLNYPGMGVGRIYVNAPGTPTPTPTPVPPPGPTPTPMPPPGPTPTPPPGPTPTPVPPPPGSDTTVALSSVRLAYTTFYPVRDSYRDTVAARGTLGEPASVSVRVVSVATGRTVRTFNLGARAPGGYSVSWNGRNSAGTLQNAGTYRLIHTVVDGPGNRATVTTSVTLSKRSVVWRTVTLTKQPNRFSMKAAAGGGAVSTSRSAYTGGVYLSSGAGFAATTYAFSLPSAVTYKTLSFKVLGRSRNTFPARIGLWNPALGGASSVASYDSWKRAGTGYATYTASAAGDSHQRSRVARGVLYTPYNAATGARPIFDAARMQLTISYAVWR